MTDEILDKAKHLKSQISELREAISTMQDDNYFCHLTIGYQHKDSEVGEYLYAYLPSSLNEKVLPLMEEELSRLEQEYDEL